MNQQSITFTRVAELYVQELRKGTAPQVDEYVRAFPHLAEQIQLNFPTLRIMESVTPRTELKEGDELGGCIIESEIGRGGMGIVYRAYDRVNQRDVAVKALHLRGLEGRDSVRFEYEREAMARLNHPNIVPVYSHGCNDDFAFLVMKLIVGVNLSQLLKGEASFRALAMLSHLRSDWKSFAEMAAQIASGLQHAHENGLVHRDVKPANLLLDREGKVWISDFGLAKLSDSPHSISLTGDVIGTPRYMAPEQVQGICDARSDIYSLGLTLYELASNHKASPGETFGSVIRNRVGSIRDIRDVAPEVPSELGKIIMRACQHDADNRYQTANEMQYVLERYSQGFNKADRRDNKRPSDEVYRQRMRKNIRIAIATSACIFLIAISYPYLLNLGRRVLKSPTSQSAIGKSWTMQELEAPTQKLIDQLAQGNQDDVIRVVSDVLEDSIKSHSTTQWNYSSQAKQDLLNQVSAIKQMFQDRRLSPEHMNQFMNLYRKSTMAVAGRLLHIIPQIEQNIPEPSEQNIAYEELKKFSSAIINKAVDKTEANRFIDSLVRGDSIPSTNPLSFASS